MWVIWSLLVEAVELLPVLALDPVQVEEQVDIEKENLPVILIQRLL